MFKKISTIILLIVLVAAGIVWFRFLRSATSFSSESKVIYIHTDAATKEAVLRSLEEDSITNVGAFDQLAGMMNYWGSIKPGRYKIKKGTSVYALVKQLRNGKQTPVDLVISRKIRFKEDLAELLGNYFECDSAAVMGFLNNEDSLKHYGLDSATWQTAIIHDTYSIPWTWSPSKIFRRLYSEQQAFWQKKDRSGKANALGYTPLQVYILASIVSDETNVVSDKPLIARVYMNRLAKGMRLQADPTVKFAIKDMSLNRILFSHLAFKSPYNTYLNTGLPPGPICTVDPATIDAVLNAPMTDHLFFVAKADLRGGSTFSSTLEQHNKAAKEYQDSLTVFLRKKAAQEKARTK